MLVVLLAKGSDPWVGEFGIVGSHDFIEYWAAAQLLLQGQNPYDPAALLAVEREVGWPADEPLLMWNPPWTLTVVLPFALLPFRGATVAWVLVQLALVLGSGILLWRYFAPADRRSWLGPLLAVAFAPCLFALHMGQISPWLLAGVVGFLWAEREGRDWLAGASLSLLLIKPHTAYLFWPVALLWTLRARRPRVLGGCILAMATATVLVSLFVHTVVWDYAIAATSAPLHWITATLGAWLRLLLGPDRIWLQYLPPALGASILAVWLLRKSEQWDWARLTSPLLLASVATSAFGWSHDGVVLLPVVIDLSARIRSLSTRRRMVIIGAFGATQVSLWALNLTGANEIWYAWHPLALGVLYAWGICGVACQGGQHRPTD
jgi:hypothetical protein